MITKQHLYTKCQDVLNSRLAVLQQKISDIQNDLQSETKSTAGDKHETGRAMLQLEREKAGQQLSDIQKQFELLRKINPETKKDIVALGSVVYTSQANYFIAVSIGELKLKEQSYYAISPATPIAKLLMGKVTGDNIVFRNHKITITQII